MATQNLFPNQFCAVDASGFDVGNNPGAPITALTATVDNHAVVYAATTASNTQIPPTQVVVVARGPLGTATLTVNAKDANGNALPPKTQQFTVVQGPAVGFNLTLEPPATIGSGTPGMPVGW